MRDNQDHQKQPTSLLIIPVNSMVFLPTRQLVELFVSKDFFENNQDQFILNNVVCLVGVLNTFIPDTKQIERTGVAAEIISISREEEEIYRVVANPFSRIEISNIPINRKKPYSNVRYVKCDVKNRDLFDPHKKILSNIIKKLVHTFKIRIIPDISTLSTIEEYNLFIDQLISAFIVTPSVRQGLLNYHDVGERIWILNKILLKMLSDNDIKSDKKIDNIDSSEKTPSPPPIPEIKSVTSVFDNPPKGLEQLANKLKETIFTPEVQIVAEREFSELCAMSSSSSEYSVTKKYINWLTRFPWTIRSTENSDIKKAAKILNDSHFGMPDVKERITEHLAVNYLNPEQKGKILCFVGPPGTGKTSISKAIAHAMGRKFARFSVGGMRDEAEIKGHRRTYVGALPGKFTSLLAECGTKNPVITIDEIDKMTSNSQGNPSAALLELLDPEQNSHFIDHYFGEIPIDASEVFFITTANDLSTIEPALRDRLEVIKLHSYTELEKLEIAKSFLIPKQLKSNGINDWGISFSNESILYLIDGYTREAGVRNLEREIGNVCRKIATNIVMDEPYDSIVNNETIESLLNSPTYKNRNNFKLDIGEVKGLAWTSVGGKVLKAQVIKTMNTSAIEKTGSLGDTMKESITTALNLAINFVDKDKEAKDLTLKKCGLQIHFPAGATPKDGPSAGITIFTALVSALTGQKVNPCVAMTGEVDALENVLPVGGLKEKIIAAYSEGIKKVIISSMNKGDKDLIDLPKEVTDAVEIIYVEKVMEVLNEALLKEDNKDLINLSKEGTDIKALEQAPVKE